MESAGYFREKAEQCRRLASCILTRNDPTAVSLAALAREFDAAAAVIEARTAAAHAISYGDDFPAGGPVVSSSHDPKVPN